jgi:hypothetical protein
VLLVILDREAAIADGKVRMIFRRFLISDDEEPRAYGGRTPDVMLLARDGSVIQ